MTFVFVFCERICSFTNTLALFVISLCPNFENMLRWEVGTYCLIRPSVPRNTLPSSGVQDISESI